MSHPSDSESEAHLALPAVTALRRSPQRLGIVPTLAFWRHPDIVGTSGTMLAGGLGATVLGLGVKVALGAAAWATLFATNLAAG